MNVVLESQPNCIVTLQIELPADRVTKERQAIAKDFQRQARIPGYRPGKAPQSLIESRYAKDIREELESKLVRESLNEAVQEKNLRALRIDKVDNVHLGSDDIMRFSANVVIEPEFELPNYTGVAIEAAKRPVTEEDIQKWIEQFREPHASYEAVEGRPLAMEDYAVVTYEGTLDEKPISEVLPKAPAQLAGRSNAWIYINPGSLIPGFSEAVVGMSIGDERVFTLDVPVEFPLEDLRGRQVAYKVTLHGINTKTLPTVDDEFASKIEPGKTLEEIRTSIRENLEKLAEQQFDGAKRTAVLKALMAQVTFELPDYAVEEEFNSLLKEIVRENQVRGVSDDELRSHQDEIVDVAKRSASERVRGNFLLQRIAEKEELKATETDIIMAISDISQRYEIPMKKLVQDLRARNGIAPLRSQILIEKALAFVVSKATVTEPASH